MRDQNQFEAMSATKKTKCATTAPLSGKKPRRKMRKDQRKFVGEQSSPQIIADAEHIEYAETPVIH